MLKVLIDVYYNGIGLTEEIKLKENKMGQG